MKKEKEPIFTEECWICPICGYKNPYPLVKIVTYPEITCYRCEKCSYHYDEQRKLTPAERFQFKLLFEKYGFKEKNKKGEKHV